MKKIVVAVLVGATLAACNSVGIGVGVGFPIGSHGGGGVSVGGTVPLPAKPAEPPASAASAPYR
jgi:predicted small secreted protein